MDTIEKKRHNLTIKLIDKLDQKLCEKSNNEKKVILVKVVKLKNGKRRKKKGKLTDYCLTG